MQWLIFGTLFVVSYAGFLAYYRWDARQHRSAATVPAIARTPSIPAPNMRGSNPTQAVQVESPAAPVPDAVPQAATEGASSVSRPAYDEAQNRRVASMIAVAIDDASAPKRMGAIRALGNEPLRPDIVHALRRTLQTDSLPINKIEAIKSLQHLREVHGDTDGEIGAAIASAAQDTNNAVAQFARKAGATT